MTRAPPRPTPITVAGVLLIVAGCGFPLAGVALCFGIAEHPKLPVWAGLLCCWFLVPRGRRLLRGRADWVWEFGAVIGFLSVLGVGGLSVAMWRAVGEIGLPRDWYEHVIYGGVVLALGSALSVLVASVALVRQVSEYFDWCDAREYELWRSARHRADPSQEDDEAEQRS